MSQTFYRRKRRLNKLGRCLGWSVFAGCTGQFVCFVLLCLICQFSTRSCSSGMLFKTSCSRVQIRKLSTKSAKTSSTADIKTTTNLMLIWLMAIQLLLSCPKTLLLHNNLEVKSSNLNSFYFFIILGFKAACRAIWEFFHYYNFTLKWHIHVSSSLSFDMKPYWICYQFILAGKMSLRLNFQCWLCSQN